MKILMIHNRYRQPGGEDKAFDLEKDLLKQKEHEVETIVFSNETVSTSGWERIAGMRRAIYNPDSKKTAVEVIRRFQPEIVHVHNLFFAASPSILDAAKENGIPVVMTLHNYRLICCNALLLRNGQPCEVCRNKTLPADGIKYKCFRDSRAASAMVTLVTGIHKIRKTWSEGIARYIVLTDFAKTRFSGSSLNLPADRFVVKPNFVPDTGEGEATRDNFFLFAGRLSKEKGVDPLMAVFSRRPDLLLEVAGDGPERQRLEETYGHCVNIRFLGPVSQPRLMEKMRTCRALVFPSLWYEGLPFVILEAFCAGTPVIASDLGSMTEMIADGVNGLHFPAGDETGLSQALDRFTILSKILHRGARETFLQRYHPEIHYDGLMQIYNQVMVQEK